MNELCIREGLYRHILHVIHQYFNIAELNGN